VAISPCAPSPLNRYSRLLPPSPPLPEEPLRRLAESMCGNHTTIPAARWLVPPPAAYTYFAQFIDHDLSLDETELADAGAAPAETPNFAGGLLDLSHVYGGGPASAHAHLYDSRCSFRLGEARLPNGAAFDLPLLAPNESQPHPCNTQNLILRQLHAMFLKLHNLMIEERGNVNSSSWFAEVRQRVTWQYQWLVRNDFLWRVCRPEVVRAVTSGEDRRIEWEQFSVPVEFSLAAFRFGHSMVRSEYTLRRHTAPRRVEELFSRELSRRALEPEEAIDWDWFSAGKGETAQAIDTRIVEALHDLTRAFSHKPSSPPPGALPLSLPLRTLLRGNAVGLPSGEAMAEAFGREALPTQEETPLFPWILLEAEVESAGSRLGTVGSRIVAETIEAALWADENSYLRRFGRDWTPPPVRGADGELHLVRNLGQLAKCTGLLVNS
jgi:hypothetical protein